MVSGTNGDTLLVKKLAQVVGVDVLIHERNNPAALIRVLGPEQS